MFTSFQAFVTLAELPDLHHTRKTTCCTQLFLSQCLHCFRQREAFLKPQKTSATRDRQFVSTPALIVTPLPSFSRNSSRNSSQLSFRIQFEVNLLKYLTLPKRATTRWSPVFVMIRISVQGEAPSPSYLDEDLFLTKR